MSNLYSYPLVVFVFNLTATPWTLYSNRCERRLRLEYILFVYFSAPFSSNPCSPLLKFSINLIVPAIYVYR